MIKRVLVAGGAGFLGQHLCEKLLLQGNRVICIDNFYTGSRENIAHLIPNPLFEVIQHDLTIPVYVEVDEIYNLACPASPVFFQRDPIQTIKINVYGSINLLELAKRDDTNILQVSTASVQGELETTDVRSCYGAGKRCAEILFFSYHRQYKTRIKVVRLFNNYGPGMNLEGGEIIPRFITQAFAGKDLVVYNNGSSSRSFCYIDDIIDGLVKVMSMSDDFIGPVNLNNMVETTFLELAEMIIRLTGTKSKIVSKSMAMNATPRRKMNLVKDFLGWEPTTGLETGLTKTIEYCKDFLKCR